MRKNFLFLLFSLSLALLGSSNVSAKKKFYEEEIKNHLNRFLILKNSQKYCEGSNLISITNSENLYKLGKALDICEDNKTCDFISYSPKRILRNSIFYEDEKELQNTGATWICSGDKWVSTRPRINWITAIKAKQIIDQMSGYNIISLNTSGDCDKKFITLKISKHITPKEATEECNKLPECKFIIFNYNKFNNKERHDDVAIFCSHPPISRMDKLGYFIAAKGYSSDKANSIKAKDHRKQKKIIKPKMVAFGGSLTPDDNYKNYKKGEVVPIQFKQANK
ncbi:conserved protein, unknown function [Hepatocystis sp. ex Piliocolobus tephrosceles]|nr:conserved protein, unknown function [Hepatocystis sp. ex Piliocolobus tephrosceles]